MQGISLRCIGFGRSSSIFQEYYTEGPVVIAEAMFETLIKDYQEKIELEERKRNLGIQLEEKPKVLKNKKLRKRNWTSCARKVVCGG